ncbi:MAG: hypothetical protein HZC28_17175 [Spirochaetes bacterium]|nr:hypothetical protein [Spirochaetota bacterium]
MRRIFIFAIIAVFIAALSVFIVVALNLTFDATYKRYEASRAKGMVLTNTPPSAHAGIRFVSDKRKYRRYDAVRFSFTMPNAVERPEVKIFFNKRLFTRTMDGDRRALPLHAQKGTTVFEGVWFPPLAPKLGEYEAVLTFAENGVEKFMQTTFMLDGAVPRDIDKPLAFATLEALGQLTSRSNYRAPDMTEGDWRNLVKAASFMGADVFVVNGGETTGTSGSVTADNVWSKEKIDSLTMLAEEVKQQHMQMGAWIHSFFIQFPGSETPNWLDRARSRGKDFARLGYRPSLKYESEAGEFTADWHCSLIDEKRINDVISLAAAFNRNPNIDFIGLDYIRALPTGGLELVDDFVRQMNIAVPAGFSTWHTNQRMLWLSQQRRGEMKDAWRYYKCRKEAQIVERIRREARIAEKNLWVFNLGWAHGIEHGQDPLMFLDSGADYNFIMLYEIPEAQEYNHLGRQWSSYVRGNDLNLVFGNSVDTPLLLSGELNSVEEYTRRMSYAVNSMLTEGHPRGVFFHDLWRANFGRKGEFPAMEWFVAGGKAFSDLKGAYKLVPVATKISFNQAKSTYNKIVVVAEIMNQTTGEAGPFTVKLVNTPTLRMNGTAQKVPVLIPGQSVTLTFTASIYDGTESRRFAMVPLLVTWSDTDNTKRMFDYRYIRMRNGVSVFPLAKDNAD